MYDIAVIGGGAAGCVAAISAALAANQSQSVVVVERMDRVGKKLLATGNGRCNLSSTHPCELYGNNNPLIESAVTRFGHKQTVEFFASIGLLCTTHESGRIYPYSMQAGAVLETLRNAMAAYSVSERCSFHVEHIDRKNTHYIIHPANGQPLSARSIILTTGGCAAPAFGSDGSGYRLAEGLGHSMTAIHPALVPLKSNHPACKALNGIRANAIATAISGGKQLASEAGEVQFTAYGLSGIPIMQISRLRADTISLDMMPEYSHEQLADILAARQSAALHPTLESLLVGMVNKKLGYALLKSIGLSPLSRRVCELKAADIQAIARRVKAFDFEILGDTGYANAQVTAGGIDSNEFDSDLQSLLVPGLYAAGELLDIYGGCGGHNLQWAWASGYISGQAAALSLQ